MGYVGVSKSTDCCISSQSATDLAVSSLELQGELSTTATAFRLSVGRGDGDVPSTSFAPEKTNSRSSASAALVENALSSITTIDPALLLFPAAAVASAGQRHWSLPNPRYPIIVPSGRSMLVVESIASAPRDFAISWEETEKPAAAKRVIRKRGRTAGYYGLTAESRFLLRTGAGAQNFGNVTGPTQNWLQTADWQQTDSTNTLAILLAGATGTVYNDTITLTETSGFAAACVLTMAPAVTLTETSGFAAACALIMNPSETLATTVTLTDAATLIMNAAISAAETCGFSAFGGFLFSSSINPSITSGCAFSPQYGLGGACSHSTTLGFADSAKVTFNPSITGAVTVTLADGSALVLAGASAAAVTLDQVNSATLRMAAAITLNEVLQIIVALIGGGTLYADTIALGITPAMQVSLFQILLAIAASLVNLLAAEGSTGGVIAAPAGAVNPLHSATASTGDVVKATDGSKVNTIAAPDGEVEN